MSRGRKRKFAMDLAQLRLLYVDQELSTHEVSRETGAAQCTVRYWVRKLGLMRSRSDAARIQFRRQMETKFTCRVCGQRNPISELVEDKRYVPWPRYCCRSCAGY